MKVDFIGIGFNRSGTSWIAKCLDEHPEICVSRPKETFYYSNDYFRGPEYHECCFDHCEAGAKVRGEFTPSYIYTKKSLQLIKEDHPEAKILVSVRDPLDRTISHINHHRRKGKYKFQDIRTIIKEHKIYKEYSCHEKYIARARKILPDLHVFYIKDDEKVIRELYKLLGVDPNFNPPSLRGDVNVNKYFIDNLFLRYLGILLPKTRLFLRKVDRILFKRKIKELQAIQDDYTKNNLDIRDIKEDRSNRTVIK
jgi:hypothetical protein